MTTLALLPDAGGFPVPIDDVHSAALAEPDTATEAGRGAGCPGVR